jgi:N-acyl-D-aspartate/D-glutamate deacylase
MSHDLVIRNARVVDGTGRPAFEGDVAVDGDRIAQVGSVEGRGRREIDAGGDLVAPGWVDVHTHYDGQATWDAQLSPSCWHGVTTVVMGNCGVGFAPVRASQREALIRLMEGVEDIPGTALHEGIRWEWESFPEYLDALERRRFALDVGAQLPHGAVRLYAMGERGADHAEAPTPDEITEMARVARQAVEAGALGFTTSRTINHRSSDGRHTPSLTAGRDELIGVALGLRAAGAGVLQLVSDFDDVDREFDLLEAMVAASGRPLSITLLQNPARPDDWSFVLARIERASRAGLPIKGQVPSRAIGLLLGLQATLHPFCTHPSFVPLAGLPLAERVARLRDPAVRAAILSEAGSPLAAGLLGDFEQMFPFGDPPDYEPGPEASLAARARARGVSPSELAYDALLEQDGRALLYRPVMNYAAGDLEVTRAMLEHPDTVPGLGDAGAHCGMICDGSFPTFLVSHWAKDRVRGKRLPLERLVKQQTADTAALVGLSDRGVLAPGKKADLNRIDWDALGTAPPEIVFDLPAGGRRLVQRGRGYRATVVSGQVTFEDGESTGALPGRFIRGSRSG